MLVNIILIIAGRLLVFLSKILNAGSGSTWPGHIALSVNKNFIKEIIENNTSLKVVLVAGTNGKTTTSKLIKFLLEKNSIKVFHNEAGANLTNGVASSLIKKSGLFGNINYDVAIFEIDENSLPLVLNEITNPTAVVLLNLFRDQLDRYGEVNTIALKWKSALEKLNDKTSVFLNADDPQIDYLSRGLKTKKFFFGLSKSLMNRKKIPHDVDSIYCPVCSNKLIYNAISYSHLGDYYCTKCGFMPEKHESYPDLNIKSSLFGKYNLYNINAAILLVSNIFGVALNKIKEQTKEFKPAFGRQEGVIYKGKNIIILLSKNPTGFNQSIEALSDSNIKNKNCLVVLNDRIPDGRDVSWIWDVDFEEIMGKAEKIFISGDRTFDLAIRFKNIFKEPDVQKINKDLYVIEDKTFILPNLENAIKIAVDRTQEDETLFILATYSAMLDVRKIIKGKKLL